MFYKIIKSLKESIIVSEFEILEFIDEENVKILKVKANLKNQNNDDYL
ncbi:hypothetical protein Thein_2033 [Thermodesulfatator indicus DSM 15286]|uniref:Uncharacterized protein n=1 Tax=Thermodesulfatator indicus (strain DSM 15286 / JCM 11887 / CIR29812) TaxID=667014 RepID=F8AD17_THEID|nr:hypothetical protein Thein_2033 [Thermodesulfatator indicus DSM 15286]